ncbi:MAG: adenylate/guanylate cyclase domain-containing protein, partial [Balneolales bacterium]
MTFSRPKKKWVIVTVTAMLSCVCSLFLSHTSVFRTIELKSLDLLFEMRGPVDVSGSPVVLIAISEQADKEIHERWPWPYHHHARLIDNLNRAGAKAIGLDMVLDQPDRFTPENDSILARAVAEHGNVVTAGNILVTQQHSGTVTQLVAPFDLLDEENPNPWGLISVNNDDDGFLRRYALGDIHLERTYHAFALELLKIYLDLDEMTIEDTGRYFQVGPLTIPKYDEQTMLINYHGEPGSFLVFSYDQVVDDRNFTTVSDEIFFSDEELGDRPYGFFDDPDFGLLYSGDLQGKIVLVGSTMPELHDFFSTPFAPRNTMPGFEVHANVLQTLLTGNYIRNASLMLSNLIVFSLAIFAALLTVYAGAISGFLAILLLSVAYIFFYFLSFIEYAFLLEITGPLLVVSFSFMSAQIYNYLTEQNERKRIQAMFGSYVSPVLVKKMVDSGKEPNLGGEEVNITALFSDIESFSAFSEKLAPSQLVDLINEYLTAMTDIITDQGATLDKYIGDAIVAFFGAPLPVDDHA